MNFTILKETKLGRLGLIECSHGVVETPAFIFCATKGAIKSASIDTVKRAQTQVILSNTYNLMDYPGGDLIEKSGGIHKMMGWDGPMWTDSGGFQVFSLGYGSVADEIKGRRNTKGSRVKIAENGITFQSPRDGSTQELTPEKSMLLQKQIGADFVFVLDECTPYRMTKEQITDAMNRSHRWAKRSYDEFHAISTHTYPTKNQKLYGIVQGGVHADLRMESIDFANNMDFFGYGIGGSLGTIQQDMINILELCDNNLLKSRPKHLLGIGKMNDILNATKYNIDTFDCVHPTRIARHGCALVSQQHWIKTNTGYREHISIKNAQYKYDYSPLDDTCACYVCKNYTRSYLHYLYVAKEITCIILLTEHNMHFMNQFMESIRNLIRDSE